MSDIPTKDLDPKYGYRRLSFITNGGEEHTTGWIAKHDDLDSLYNRLRDMDSIERVWIYYLERSMGTGE